MASAPSAMPTGSVILLSGIVGSTAYGLNRPGSDIDRLAVFAAPTNSTFSLTGYPETVVTRDPDTAFHEAGKYVRLALAANPTITELLWLDNHETTTRFGQQLIDLRSAFLSGPRVKDAYLGYARSQFARLRDRNDGTFSSDTKNRARKHARHMARLMRQGYDLYTTGMLTVRVDNPDWYHEFSDRTPAAWSDWFAREQERFSAAATVLPDTPDRETVQAWLTDVRYSMLDASTASRVLFGIDSDTGPQRREG